MIRISHSTRLGLATMTLLACAGANAQQARGVNPADIDSRIDFIAKRIRLDPTGTTDSLTVKYDYRLSQNWGLNLELPAYARLSVADQTFSGNGDLFARARWIVPAGDWTYGASFETVLPAASEDLLGTGKYQLNAAVLAVRVLSPSFIAAFAVKQVTSVGGDAERASFSNTELRIIPVVILQDGWAITGEIRQTWEHRSDVTWQRLEGTVSKQFTQQWAASLGYGRDLGDRVDRGTLSGTVKYFF